MRTCHQLRESLRQGPGALLQQLFDEYLLRRLEAKQRGSGGGGSGAGRGRAGGGGGATAADAASFGSRGGGRGGGRYGRGGSFGSGGDRQGSSFLPNPADLCFCMLHLMMGATA